MKSYYPGPAKFIAFCIKAILLSVLILGSALAFSAHAQSGLVFKNASLITGSAGQDGAVYRFPLVGSNIDALVKITSRSSSLVKLVNIDIANTGWDKAFQPQVTYNNNTTPNGVSDWWMEFQFTFVTTNTTTPVAAPGFDVTALDIDGNGDKINEWVSFYNQKTSIFESNTLLSSSSLLELILGLLTPVGKKFTGPVTNFGNIDTSATRVMVTNNYLNQNQFRIRTGGHSTGSNEAADRMYSFWFKSFSYQTPVQSTLPVNLSSFTARKADSKVILNWSTEQEKNVSHFAIERSQDGNDFTDAGILFSAGNSDVHKEYSFTDPVKSNYTGMLYYRLKTVDLDGRAQYSSVCIIRTSEQKDALAILAYPNPVSNELRVTLPSNWQNKTVTIDVLNTNGQVVKQVVSNKAGQTETIRVSDLGAGLYIVQASSGSESAMQRIIKSK